MNAFRWLFVPMASCLLLSAGCGKHPVPSYSVSGSGSKMTVTLHTAVGDIPVEIENRGSGSGTGTRNGTRSSSGVSMSYEIAYKHEGNEITLTSVKVDGKEVPKS